MLFLVHTPAFPLSEFVERLWFYDAFFPDHSKEKVLPNGRMELLIELREGPKKLYSNQDSKKFRSFRNSWISGGQTKPLVIEATQNSSMMGVTFKPGGTYPFFSFPLCELSDSVEELDLIWGNMIHVIREQILKAESPRKKFQILEQFLLKQAGGRLEANRMIQSAIHEIQQQNGLISIRKLAEKFGITHMHMIRQFEKFIGIHPKVFSRILRFQKALQLLEERKSVRWTTLALDCGYYDQSHFIHEFQLFSGYNPTTYLNVRGEYVNFIPLKDEC